MKAKKLYYFLLHAFFMTGILYAFSQFLRTPHIDMLKRRLWAYENWIIMSFYLLFVYLTLTERETKLLGKKPKFKLHINEFKRILTVNLILLIFPWGLFLILAPHDILSILRLNSIYWKVLGCMSIFGAVIYYLPHKYYKKNFTRFILIFGALDNLIAGIVVTILFLAKKAPLIAWGSIPLLFYFAYFFHEQFRKYAHLTKRSK